MGSFRIWFFLVCFKKYTCGGLTLSLYENHGHKGQGKDGHGGADGEVDAKIDVLDHKIGYQKKAAITPSRK